MGLCSRILVSTSSYARSEACGQPRPGLQGGAGPLDLPAPLLPAGQRVLLPATVTQYLLFPKWLEGGSSRLGALGFCSLSYLQVGLSLPDSPEVTDFRRAMGVGRLPDPGEWW